MLPQIYLGQWLVIYTYPLFWGIAWSAAYIYLKSEQVPQFQVKNFLYFLLIFIFSWIGAKLLFSLSEKDFLSATREIKFVSGNGFVFYGGLMAGSLLMWSLSIFDKPWWRSISKRVLGALVLGHSIGRVGCFLSGCCFGIPWKVFCCQLPHENFNRIPVPIFETFSLLIIFFILHKNRNRSFTSNLSFYFMSYGVVRFLLEFIRGDTRGEWGSFSPGMWISAGLILLGFFIRNRKSAVK